LQLIRVPVYDSGAKLNGDLTGQAWNGTIGGVLALKVNGTLNIDTFRVDMSAKGFRGGTALLSGGGCLFVNDPRRFTDINSANDRAQKGEGLAKFISGKECSRGPQLTGGGGGNNHNGGGGGGANYGHGGPGGQRIKHTTLACGSVIGLRSYGFGSPGERLFMGGGGGAGHGNNAGGRGESGGNGGGIIMIIADTLTAEGGHVDSSGSIHADGGFNIEASENEGGGGGGAGGTVVLDVDEIVYPIRLSANGGNGTDVDNFGDNCSGPGGGGGGGLFLLTSGSGFPLLHPSATYGLAGTIKSSSQGGCNPGDFNGAENGGEGSGQFSYTMNDFSDTGSCELTTALREQMIKPGPRIFPNPSEGRVSLIAAETMSISVYNSLGKQVIQLDLEEGREYHIDLPESGVYLIRASSSKQSSNHRLIIR
jgi:hypothetical protein